MSGRTRAQLLGLARALAIAPGARAQEPADDRGAAADTPGARAQETVAPLPAPDDREAVRDATARLLSAYIRVDTSNPPGNEMAGAVFVADFLRAHGLPSRTWEPASGRGNVCARLPATEPDGRGAILLLHHSDVVPIMMPAGTDSMYFRQAGIPAYGFIPAVLDPRLTGAIHGLDERIPLRALDTGVQVTYRTPLRLVAPAE